MVRTRKVICHFFYLHSGFYPQQNGKTCFVAGCLGIERICFSFMLVSKWRILFYSCISLPFFFFFHHMAAWEKQPTLSDATTGFPAKWPLRNERRNSILMTRKRMMMRHWIILLIGWSKFPTRYGQSYAILHSFLRRYVAVKPAVMASRNVGCYRRLIKRQLESILLTFLKESISSTGRGKSLLSCDMKQTFFSGKLMISEFYKWRDEENR